MVQQRIIYDKGGEGKTGRTKGKGEREWRALREGSISASTVHGTLNNYRRIKSIVWFWKSFHSTVHKLDGKPSELKKKQRTVRQYIEQSSMPEGLCWKIVRKKGKKVSQEHWSLQYAGPWIFYLKKKDHGKILLGNNAFFLLL